MIRIIMTGQEIHDACTAWLSERGIDMPHQAQIEVRYNGNLVTDRAKYALQVVVEGEADHVMGPYR